MLVRVASGNTIENVSKAFLFYGLWKKNNEGASVLHRKFVEKIFICAANKREEIVEIVLFVPLLDMP